MQSQPDTHAAHLWLRGIKRILATLALASSFAPQLQADPPPPHGVIAAHIGVLQITTGNAPSDVIVTNILAVGDFRIRSTANRGDFDIQIGESFADDVPGGILITSIAEHTRDQGDSGQLIGTAPNQVPAYTAGPHVATAHLEVQAGGSYYIPIAYTLANSVSTSVIEYNMNAAAAWFPYDKYLGAYVRNSTNENGAPNDTLYAGSPGIVVGTHFVDDGAGRSTVNLTSFGINSTRDGVLLVLGAKNEDNYALSSVNTNGTWTLYSKDNGTDTTALERDPMAFVFIPKTNQYLVSGRFNAAGEILISSGAGAPQFTVTNIDVGRWELKIPTGSPEKGVLIISPEGGFVGNRDNIVTYQPNDARDGWIIESRDLVNTAANSLPALETPTGEPVATFVYIPGSTPGFAVTPTNGIAISEFGDTATFTVALETKPKADVTITLSSTNPGEGLPSPTSITFTTNDWNIPQTITITGVDDTATDGFTTNTIILAAGTSADPDYNGRNPADVQFINVDNEGGITVNPTRGLITTEAAGTATFNVRLSQIPTGTNTVTVPLSSSDPTEGTVSPTTLIFDSTNWNVDQVVTITGVDDFVDDGDIDYTIVTAPAFSGDPYYSQRQSADVSVRNTDNDTSGVTVAPTTLTHLENGGITIFSIVLNSEPTTNVVISLVSGDTTEGTVAPTNLTFNAANWNAPQEVIITGVDDLSPDGNIRYTITNTLTSRDLTYTNINPADVSVTSLDEDALLTFASPTAFWGIGMPALSFAARATIFDTNTLDYANSTLSLVITNGAIATDRLEIRNIGTGPGQISVAGNTISYEGFQIATFTGGNGSTPLVITFNSSATPAYAQALLRVITYRDSAATPVVGSRTLTATLSDPSGATTTATQTIRVGLLRVTEFQEGADQGYGPYTGAADIELNASNPDTAYPVGRNANGLFVDTNNIAAGHVLLRFDNLVGNAPNQIPTNSIIVSAELFLDINESGNGTPLHRMLVPWDANTATWNSFFGGIALDDATARAQSDSQIGVSSGVGATTTGNVWVSVTPDVQAWVNGGATNYGWAMPGWVTAPGSAAAAFSFSPSEAANIADRPRLRVSWLPTNSVSVASFRQNVDGYTGAKDTRIRELAANADTDYSTATSVFVDAVASGTDPNQDQVLIRFDDIFGANTNQIPPGARIDAAILDLASLGNDAVGDGAQIFPIFQPWPEPVSTWNTWINGIQTNGVEAATTPSATVGNPSLNPDAQAGFLSFDLTDDVQSWSSGTRTNAGWVLIPWPGGGNGWAVRLSEIGAERERPRLRVFYTAGTATGEIRLQTPIRTANALQLNFSGAPSAVHSIRRATTVDGLFTKIGEATTSANGAGTFTDNAPPANAAFYRITSP